MQEFSTILVKSGERPKIKDMFLSLDVGQTLVVPYEEKTHNAIKQECFRQNELARAVNGEMAIKFRTKKDCENIIIYRLV